MDGRRRRRCAHASSPCSCCCGWPDAAGGGLMMLLLAAGCPRRTLTTGRTRRPPFPGCRDPSKGPTARLIPQAGVCARTSGTQPCLSAPPRDRTRRGSTAAFHHPSSACIVCARRTDGWKKAGGFTTACADLMLPSARKRAGRCPGQPRLRRPDLKQPSIIHGVNDSERASRRFRPIDRSRRSKKAFETHQINRGRP